MNIRFFLFACSLFLTLCSPIFSFSAWAQNAPVADKSIADFSARLPKVERLEGAIETTFNGATLRGQIQFQAPDKLRLEIQEGGGARAQTIVASGEETRLFDAATKRVQRLPYNLARQWWRGWNLPFGGPANFLFSGLAPDATAPFYDASAPAVGELSLAAKSDEAKTEAPKIISDSVRFGGGGDRIFYAPFKRRVWNRPAKIVLRFAAGQSQITRTETDDNAQITTATIVLGANNWPQSAVVTDAKNRVISSWKYTLAPRVEAFPDGAFSFDFAPNMILEDARLKAIREYSGADAASKLNLGTLLARQAEAWPEAFAAWEEAARLAPEATAPQVAIYEAAFITRDLDRAEAALKKLTPLWGENSFETAWHRAAVSIARRQWAEAQTALETAVRLRPQDLQARVTLADLLRARSDFNGARGVLLETLKSEEQPNSFKAQAAEMLATLAVGAATEGVLAALPNDTIWQKLARAHIELQQGDAGALVTEDVDALASWALGLERAGRDEAAIDAWQKVIERAATPSDRNARLHVMALHAKRGEVAPSLMQYRELVGTSTSLKIKGEFQDALLASWRKAFRQEQLRKVLEERLIATNASEDDARLWLKYQENYGSNEAISAAVSNGLARFDRSAWWRARQGELIAAPLATSTDTIAQERIQREALKAIDTAVALDSSQPYYAIQRALILTQRATPFSAVIDPVRLAPFRKPAEEALSTLLKQWPNDPDVQIAVASQRLALENDGAHGESIALLQSALREGVPDLGEDRHFISFSSRQIILSALRRDKKWDALSPQYAILFRSARTAEEELGVALNYLRLKMNRQEIGEIAAALVDFAREPWSFEDSQQLMQPLVNVLMAKTATPGKPAMAEEVLRALQANPSPYARLVTTYFLANAARSARHVAAQAEAPLNADIVAARSSANLITALNALLPLADAPDAILAARVAALLGEEAINRNAPEEAVPLLTRAIALEPRDVNLRVALATALLAQDKDSLALTVRDDALRALPPTFEVLHRLAKLSYQIAIPTDRENTARLANAAMNLGQSAPDVSPTEWQFPALTAARANLDADKLMAATAIYAGLASSQWGQMDRAVALIDWEQSLRNSDRAEQADKIAAQLKALELSPQQQQMAENAWASLN